MKLIEYHGHEISVKNSDKVDTDLAFVPSRPREWEAEEEEGCM